MAGRFVVSGKENKTACVFSISANGIPHQLQAANLPCLLASNVPNSFVLLILEVERQSCSKTGSMP